MSFWHSRAIDDLEKEFGSNTQTGLSEAEAARRLMELGANELPEGRREGLSRIFFRQFQSPLIYILFVAGVIVWLMGDLTDAFLILTVLLFNATIGTIQEGRAQNTLAALKKFTNTSATVLRDEKELIIPDREVVPGDIVLLEEGERVAADARVLESRSLRVEEAALTGESVPVYKEPKILPDTELPATSQTNMLFKGTAVVTGRGRGIVVATGLGTVIGKISSAIAQVESEIPLKRDIRRLSNVLLWAVLALSAAIFVLGILRGMSITEMFATTVALAISVIPEGLPVVLTLILASGMWRMAKRNALVKKLQAVEALGQAKVIAVDKTGTLTRNEMVTRKVYMDGGMFEIDGVGYEAKGEVKFRGEVIDPPAHPELLLMGRIAAFSADARVKFMEDTATWKVAGDPTEAALLVFSEKMGFHRADMEREFPLITEVPFDYHTRTHVVSHDEKNGNQFVSVAGAPEAVLSLCGFIYRAGRVEPLDKKGIAALQHRFLEMSEGGLRVVAAGFKEAKMDSDPEPGDLTFAGFFGIEDSLRPEVPAAVMRANEAGIRVVMITGDAKSTAIAIAREAGIWKDGEGVALTNEDIAAMSAEDLKHALSRVSVFARITPEDKMRIVEGYKLRGEVVAMTGDGVNDAPPLVAADLGVAMGKIGTEVAREAADIILLDDNFGSIISAVEEGRNMYRTIQKTLLFLFSTSLGELLTIMGAILIGIPIPLSAAQILWLNLVTDSFVAFALAMDNREKGLMKDPEFRTNRFLINRRMVVRMVLMSAAISGGALYLFMGAYESDMLRAWSLTLTALAMFQWLNGWNCRSESDSVFRSDPFANRYLIGGVAFAAGLHLVALYYEPLQSLLRTIPLSGGDWLRVIAVCSSIILVDEAYKFVYRIMKRRTAAADRIAVREKLA